MTRPASITCPDCGAHSTHPEDIAAGYCTACHDWTSVEPLMRTYTIYRGATDALPARFCLREWRVRPGGTLKPGPMRTAGTLEQARAMVPARADVCLQRADTDDHTIVETWL